MIVGAYENFEQALVDLLPLLGRHHGRRLIRIEGHCCAGKSPLSRMLGKELQAPVFHADDFCIPRVRPTHYWRQFDHRKWRKALEARPYGEWTIIEGVCLSFIAREALFGDGYKIYIKPLRYDPFQPTWFEYDPHGFDPFSKPKPNMLDESVLFYHAVNRPHEQANFVLQVPANPNRPPPRIGIRSEGP